MVRKLTGAQRRDQASLASLKSSLQGIEARTEDRRAALKQAYGRDWEKMERRHAAERDRDERLIERKRSEGARGRAGEIARKSFKVRAGSETARHSPAPSDKERMAKALAKAARKTESDRGQAKGEVSDDRLERATRRAERAERRRNRPRDKGRDFERE